MNRLYTGIFTITLLLLLGGCATMNVDRGRIEDSFTITVNGEYPDTKNAPFLPFKKPILIKENTFFDLGILKLNDNNPRKVRNVCTPDGYKRRPITNYDIKLESEDGKAYYGRIAFFKARQKASTKAVTSYYKISFSQKFAEATGGRTAFYYEYYDLHKKDFPTWIMWVSDAPIK